MNSKFIYLWLVFAACACLAALAQDDADTSNIDSTIGQMGRSGGRLSQNLMNGGQAVGQNSMPTDPNCLVRQAIKYLTSLFQSLQQGGASSGAMNSAASSPIPSQFSSQFSSAAASRLSRRKRQAEDYGAPQQLQLQPQFNPSQQQQPSREDVINYNQNIKRQENSLQSMMRQIMESPYMPSKEQMIQLLTTILTLALMMAFGPAMGANSGLISSIVRQVVPFVVSSMVQFASNPTNWGSPMSMLPGGGSGSASSLPGAGYGAGAGSFGSPTQQAPITNVPLQPVSAQQSSLIQAI